MAYLHAMDIIHRDLKGLNVLVDRNLGAKVVDFGLTAVKLFHGSPVVGTPYWMAPELLTRTGAVATKAADVYSFAIVMYEVWPRPAGAGRRAGAKAVAGGWGGGGGGKPGTCFNFHSGRGGGGPPPWTPYPPPLDPLSSSAPEKLGFGNFF